ncbi:MAG: C39 family peptidase [Candidatus Rifleibacteriota bacterium]
MKYNYSLKAAILSLACLLMLAFFLQNAAQATMQEDLDRLKYKYENLYKQYSESLKDGASSSAAELGKKVKTAKRQYDEALQKFKMSQSRKDSIKETANKVKDKVTDVFSTNINKDEDATAEENKTLPGYEDLDISIEGNNYCGQFAMTSVLNGMGLPAGAQDVYKDTNPSGIFTSPPTVVEYLRMNGVDASQKHNASVADIIKKIDEGKPVLVLMDSGTNVPHWVNIYGYKTDSQGNITSLVMRDSYWGTKKGHEMEIDRFKELWGAPLGTKVAGNLSGYKNLMINIGETGEPQKAPHLFNFNFWTATEDNISSGINDTVTGFKNMSPTQLAGGLTKCILGIPGAASGIAGNAFSSMGSKMTDWGKNKFREDGIGNKLLGGASIVGGGVAKAAGLVNKAVGNVASGVASAAGNFFKKLGHVFS